MNELNDTIIDKESKKDKPRQRESNLELFRIISMLLIVACHYVVSSGLNAKNGPLQAYPHSARSVSLILFGAWGKTGINCFLMITGYFMCKSQITAKKFAKLVCEFMFYRIVLYGIFTISGYVEFSSKGLIKTIIPIRSINDNFTNCFTMFWLFIPFLNILVQKMNERQHVRLISLCGFLYIILGTFGSVTMNYVSWFMVIYFIASYLRIYPKKCFSNTKLWGILTLCSVCISSLSVLYCVWFGQKTNGKVNYYAYVFDSNTILAVVTAICAFMLFKNLNIKYNRFINTVAASTFGVLCLHASSDYIRRWIWKDTLNNVGNYKSPLMPLHAIGSVLGVFAVGVIIDVLRIKLLERPFFKFWDKHWDGFASRFKKIEDKVLRKMSIEDAE